MNTLIMDAGQVIGSKYKIIETIGQGGTSVVYLAENLAVNNIWAVKAIPRNSPWFLTEINELMVLKDLSHPMLPRITDYFEDENACYIIMDYFPGTNLQDYVSRNGPIEETQLIKWTEELIDVLIYLHGQNPAIIYRDMKPGNFIVTQEGRLKLIDFGTARYSKEGALEDTVYIGTQGYAAPEQYGTGVSDERTDYYSLGMTLLHLATGIHPLQIRKDNVIPLLKKAGISKRFAGFISELIEPDPANRPRNSDDLLKKFHKATRKTPIQFHYNKDKIVFGNGKSTLAVASILPNSGVTSLCIALGICFKKSGYRTALAELNNSGDFERIKSEFETLYALDDAGSNYFQAEGLRFYPSVTDAGIIPKNQLDIIIQDLGTMQNERTVREFNRADIKIILCPNVFWKFSHIKDFENKFSNSLMDDWIYAVFSHDKHEEKILKKNYKLNTVLTFPQVFDIFNPSGADLKLIKKAVIKLFGCTGQKVGI